MRIRSQIIGVGATLAACAAVAAVPPALAATPHGGAVEQAAKDSGKEYYASQVTQKAVCNHTGVSGATGAATAYVFVLKGKTASPTGLSCTRADAVLKAGKKYMWESFDNSVGKTVTVDSTKYTLHRFLFVGGSGFSPAFVTGNTLIVARYASGI